MIKDILELKNFTVYALSKKSGIAYSTLSDIVSEKTNIKKVSAEVLYKLSQCLEVSMESLYFGGHSPTVINIYNEDRTVHIKSGDFEIQYMGPKNLVSFKKVNGFVSGCVYVDTYFMKKDGNIYLEEDYIDLGDLCDEYGIPESVLENLTIRIGRPGLSKRKMLLDSAILVSDYMAISESDVESDSIVVEVSNIARTSAKMQLRLSDYAVLSTNMSKKMQKRAIDAAKRNVDIIKTEITKRKKYA